jgi:thymidylate synthase (FAD)
MSDAVLSQMVDVLADASVPERLEVLPNDTGFVRLVDISPRVIPAGQTADYAIVQAARVSYGQGTKKVNEDRGLIRYLLRHRHTTPFEMVRFKFHLRMPIFVKRQFERHRTSDMAELEIISNDESARKFLSINEYSARYSVVPDIAFLPDPLRTQSVLNKQGSGGALPAADSERLQSSIAAQQTAAYRLYQDLLDAGVARELARTVLPVSFITEFYVSMDLWNLMSFLRLRCDSHAQEEIRVFALAMAEYVRLTCPISYEAWKDYIVGATTFSALEMNIIKSLIESGEGIDEYFRTHPVHGLSPREVDEFKLKVAWQR